MQSTIAIGIDPSFTRTGIVVLDDDRVLVSGSVYNITNAKKGYNKIKGKMEECNYANKYFSGFFKKIDHKYSITKGEYERIVLYNKTLFNLLGSIMKILNTSELINTIFNIGVEIPMGSHLGGGAKADRMYALTLLALRDLSKNYKFVNVYTFVPSEIKKYVTGKGNSKKGLMLKEVYKRWGFETDYDDTADAYGIAKLVQHTVKGEKDNG